MSDYIGKILFMIGSYLLGAIPFGLMTAKAMGAGDIRKKGSGNIGATNVLRNVGKLGGFITLFFDSIKGVIPSLIARLWWGIDTWTLGVALVTILGHNYPIYLRFKGGKGVATSLGVLMTLWPYAGLMTLGIWVGSVLIWKISSLAALISFASLPILIYIEEKSILYFIFALLISLMIFYRHIENIHRLLTGKEKKIGKAGGRTLPLLILVILLSGNRGTYAEGMTDRSTIPPEVERIWEARRVAITAGDKIAADARLDDIVEMRYQLGINRIDEIAALLVREGYQSLEKGMVEEAYKLSNKGKEISPDYAPLYLLSATILFKKSDIMGAISEYGNGLKISLNDFWTLFNILGRLYTTAVIAISFTLLTFLIVWLWRILPIFFHFFREATSGFIDRPLQSIFFGTMIILPLIFGIGWSILFWIAWVWIYLSRKEKGIALLIVAFFLSLPYSLKYNALYMAGQDNVTLQGLLAADKGYGDQELIDRLKDKYKGEPDNAYLPLSIAYLSYKRGHMEEALNYYNRLINTGQKDIKISVLNGIGNVHFKEGKYDDAIAYYKKALDEAPDGAIPQYNMSQAYREKLMFAEAESSYDTAKRMNPADVERYTALTTKGKGYEVIDFPVNRRNLWAVVLRPTEDAAMLSMGILRGIIKIPPERFYYLGLSAFLILAVLTYLKPQTPMAYPCPRCGHVVCGWCTGSRIFGGPCKGCRGKDGAIERIKDLDRRISFILPGVWHIYKGWVGVGGLICLLFFTGLSGLVLLEIADDTWHMAYNLHGWSIIIWLALISVSYLILPFHFKYVKIRFNI